MTPTVSDEKESICTAALYVVGSPIPLMVAFKIFSNLWFSSVLTMTYIHIYTYIYVRCGFLCNYSVWSSLNILNLYIQSITKLGNILAFTYSYFFCPTFFCSSEDTIIYTLNCLILPHMALNFCAFFSSLQSFFSLFLRQDNFYSFVIHILLLSLTVWVFVCSQSSVERPIYISSLQPLLLFTLKHSLSANSSIWIMSASLFTVCFSPFDC